MPGQVYVGTRNDSAWRAKRHVDRRLTFAESDVGHDRPLGIAEAVRLLRRHNADRIVAQQKRATRAQVARDELVEVASEGDFRRLARMQPLIVAMASL